MHHLTNPGTADKLRLSRSSAAALDVITSFADLTTATQAVTEDREVHAFSSASTDDILAGPASGNTRKIKEITIRNKDAALSCDVGAIYFVGGTTSYELIKVTVRPGETLIYSEATDWFLYTALATSLNNESTASQTGFAADTYLVGSNISIPSNLPLVGTTYRLWFDITKTAAGTAALTLIIRFGTNGSTVDTALCTLTFGAGTAAIDSGMMEVHCVFRSVGSGSAAVLQTISGLTTNLTTTGLSNAVKAKQSTSAGFDSTVANSIIGASYNGGASAAHTIQMVKAELIP